MKPNHNHKTAALAPASKRTGQVVGVRTRRHKIASIGLVVSASALATQVVEADVLHACTPNSVRSAADLSESFAALDRARAVASSAERTGSVAPGTQVSTTIPELSTTFTLAVESLVQLQSTGVQRTSAVNATCHPAHRYVVDSTPQGDASQGQRLHVSSPPSSWHSTSSLGGL